MQPIALDAMGGDYAPEATVAGAVRAAQTYGASVLLVGDEMRLRAALEPHGPVPSRLTLVHAPSVIGMEESPGTALLRKRDSSLVIATELVREGKAAAIVSAGNSGAAMGAAALRLGLLPGIERPAIAMVLPNRRTGVIVLDGGATVDTTADQLVNFARMGAVYATCLLGIEQPRIGLLNIGTEDSKGNALVKQTYPLLQARALNFIGYVEGQQIALGEVDVIVCDGFVGNVILKTIEGYAELFWSMAKHGMCSSLRGKLGGWLVRPALKQMKARLNYASYGGALLVGVNGIALISHGRSSPEAIASALRTASELAHKGIMERLRAALADAPPAAARGDASS